MCEADAEPFMIDGGQGAELNKSFLKKRLCRFFKILSRRFPKKRRDLFCICKTVHALLQ